MKYKYVALCQEPDYFNNNLLFNKEYASKFPGSSWLPLLKEGLEDIGLELVTGDIVLEKVKSGLWNASEILLIQHDLSPRYAEPLLNYGATPFILSCYETPLFATEFCRKLPEIAANFEYRFLYNGLFDIIPEITSNNITIRFPSFNLDEIMTPVPWNDRSFMTMVAGNKFSVRLGFIEIVKLVINRWQKIINPKNWKKYILHISKKITQKKSSNKEKTRFDIQCEQNGYSEIQSKRLEAIEYFGTKEVLDLFGTGWNNLDWLGSDWKRRLSTILKKTAKGPCDDKFITMSKYKFYLCFENIFYKGAYSEKIIDCFKCGVIPVYYGIPDISDYVPSDSFIDVQKMSSWDELYSELIKIDEKTALKMIESGQRFLLSNEAYLHTYKGHAEYYVTIFKNFLSKENIK